MVFGKMIIDGSNDAGLCCPRIACNNAVHQTQQQDVFCGCMAAELDIPYSSSALAVCALYPMLALYTEHTCRTHFNARLADQLVDLSQAVLMLCYIQGVYQWIYCTDQLFSTAMAAPQQAVLPLYSH
jgi:hypothetical protein